MKRIIAMSGVSQDAYGRWFWWTIDDVGFYEKVAVASAWRHPVNPWRHAWTRAKHLRRAALWYRVRGQVLHVSTTPANLCHECRAAQASVLWEKAAERADWGTRP